MAANMNGGDSISRSLKEALFETLTAILSSSQELRASAEEQLKALEVTEEFGIHLAELTVDPNGPLAVRQLASVLLKQYVECHWSSQSNKFRVPETSDVAKASIRHILPHGLRESISKVRSSVAYAITAIAHWDWPENWPELFDTLMQCLKSDDSKAVHGAMRVLTEFSREVSDTQMPGMAPVILPEMYRIFMEPQKYSIRTRGRAVEIFCTCTGMIVTMSEYNKGIAKTLLFPMLPTFTEALVQGLQVPDGMTSDSGLKMEILKALTVLVKNFPKQMSNWLPQILPPVWRTLTDSAGKYVRTVVNDTEEADEAVDSDGEVLGFENLVFSIFEFVHGLVETPKFRGTVKKGMVDLMYYIVLYMQITEDQIRTWTNNPDQFVEDEDDDSFSYSVRISAQDLLLALAQEFEVESASGLCNAIGTHLREADTLRESGNSHWWKLHESSMLALGSVKELILEQLQSLNLLFDLPGFLESVILADLNSSASPFLVGRCLWTASCFSLAMSPGLIQRFLQATVNGLHENQPSSVRVSAVRAVWGFCDHLKRSNSTDVILPYLNPILEGLINLAIQYSSEVLALVLETISIVVSVNKAFTASCESKVTPLTIAVFLKHNSDPVITSLAQEIFKELSHNEACQEPLQQRLVPTLLSILNASNDKIPMGLQAVALDMLQTVVRSSSKPLSPVLISQAFPAAAHCTLHTDDNSTMQSGGECLRSYISVAVEQVMQWQDEQGNNGLWYLVQVAAQLLNPHISEFTAAFVGRLISTLIGKAGEHLGENLDLLLKAVLSKMQQAETLSVIQSLVMVFAHLVLSQMDAVLNFLSSVPGPTGKSALEFVLTEWCSRQHLFFGNYEVKVSTAALCKLLQYGVTTSDSRLGDIRIRGDQIFSESEGIKTRQKTSTNPAQWTVIPLLVKIYKLIINELSNVLESNMAHVKEDDCNESDGWDEDDDDDDGTNNIDEPEGQPLSSLLSQFAPASDFPGYDDQVDEEDDPDAVADPLYQLNLQVYLTEFLQSFARQPYFGVFMEHHTVQEKQVLATIGINV